MLYGVSYFLCLNFCFASVHFIYYVVLFLEPFSTSPLTPFNTFGGIKPSCTFFRQTLGMMYASCSHLSSSQHLALTPSSLYKIS
jgi:hypothetical protein